MSRYIPESIRELVGQRANFRCEYCPVYEKHSFLAFHREHIIRLKHGGSSDLDNLAYSCPICNINKGSDIATFIESSKDPVRFFNPRFDLWSDHFSVDTSGLIVPNSDIGEATCKILDLNSSDSIIERKALLDKDLF